MKFLVDVRVSVFLLVLCAFLGIAAFDQYKAARQAREAYEELLRNEDDLRLTIQQAQSREIAANERIQGLEHSLAQALKATLPPPAGMPAPDGNGTPSKDYAIKDSSGKTFIVPQEDYVRFVPRSLALEKESAALQQRKTALEQQFALLKGRQAAIKPENVGAAIQFNLDVEKVKAQEAKFNEDMDLHNSEIKDFNAEVRRVAISSK